MTRESLMDIPELSAYLRVTPRTIYSWLKSKKIPAVRLVGQWRFKKDRIDQWLEMQMENN
ncbi:MAG: helix-turn-helix domain-containing protein [Candidatus Omnitrophota bacterium]